jgi:hypothetical protein
MSGDIPTREWTERDADHSYAIGAGVGYWLGAGDYHASMLDRCLGGVAVCLIMVALTALSRYARRSRRVRRIAVVSWAYLVNREPPPETPA